MSVFKQRISTAINAEIPRIQGSAANLEIWLMESDLSKAKIYQGDSLDEMHIALDKWSPSSGVTNTTNTLQIARSLVGAEGAVSYITDTPLEGAAPYNTSVLAIGENIANCGVTGVSFEQRGENMIWKALIKNYASTPQERSWSLESTQDELIASTKPSLINLEAGQIITIQGLFPNDAQRARIVLSEDDFQLDNTLPLVRPLPKPLIIESSLPAKHQVIGQRILNSFPHLIETQQAGEADLQLTSTNTTPTQSHLIVFPQDNSTSRPYLTGAIAAPKHPLTEGLNWQTLLIRDHISLPYSQSDSVLLWQGKRPLIILREHPTEDYSALIFNFDIAQSNALKQPSFAVLLLRFCEQLRDSKIAPETRITETNEPLQIAYQAATQQDAPSAPRTLRVTDVAGKTLSIQTIPALSTEIKAPSLPHFFTIEQGDQILFTSASYFADTRESDFSLCETDTRYTPVTAKGENRHTREDHYWRIWVTLTLGLISASWWMIHTKGTSL